MPGLIEKGTSSMSSGQAVSQVKLWADKINIDGPVSHLAYVRIERTGCSVLVFFFLLHITQERIEMSQNRAECSAN